MSFSPNFDDDSVEPQDALSMMKSGAVLIDVRTDEEWNGGHAVGAEHIALDTFDAHMTSLDKNIKYLIICKSGARSAMATHALCVSGFDAKNVEGGMMLWSSMDLPMEGTVI